MRDRSRLGKIKKFFDNEIDGILSFYTNTLDKLTCKDDESRLASQTLMSAATIWECYLNDLVIEYIRKKPDAFYVHLKNSLKHKRTHKQKLIQKEYTVFQQPRRISLEKIVKLIDRNERNITFVTASDLGKKAKKWISEEYRDNFICLPEQKRAVIDLLISLRNFIAHGSDSSLKRLNLAIKSSHLSQYNLRRNSYGVSAGVSGHGKYLNAKKYGKTRVEVIITLIREIGSEL